MINIAIVDDDVEYRRTLVAYLEHFERDKGEKFAITQFRDGEDLIAAYDDSFDIVLLDIEMKRMDGVEAARKIRERDREVVIIFITNCAQFAINGYEVEALDYVLKPIAYFAFSERIDRAIERMKRRKSQYLKISTGKGNLQRVAVSDLYYVEVFGHSLVYHTSTGEINTTGAIGEVESVLDPKQFFRCNKGYLVNLEHVEGIEGYIAKVGPDELQVSRAKKKAFLDALNDYINEVAK